MCLVWGSELRGALAASKISSIAPASAMHVTVLAVLSSSKAALVLAAFASSVRLAVACTVYT